MKSKNLSKSSFRQIIFFYVAILFPLLANAQWQGYKDCLKDPNLPAFVKAMNSPRPNVEEVTLLYEQYYNKVIAPLKVAHKANPATANLKFKNQYEHLFKVWRIQTANYITPDGFVDYSSEADSIRALLIKRIHVSAHQELDELNNSSWVPIGPMQVLARDDDKPISAQVNVFCLARSASPLLDHYLYAGTESGGLFKSIDTGQNWEQVGTDQNFSIVYSYPFKKLGQNKERIIT